jgi:hypothetical protein
MAQSGLPDKYSPIYRATLYMPPEIAESQSVHVKLEDYDFEKDIVKFQLRVAKEASPEDIAIAYERVLKWWMQISKADGVVKQWSVIVKEKKRNVMPWLPFSDPVSGEKTLAAVAALFKAKHIAIKRRNHQMLIVSIQSQ